MNLELDIDTYIKQIIEELKQCTSGEELNEKAGIYAKILNDWCSELSYEKQLEIYRKFPNLISKYLMIGDRSFYILEGRDCENCVFGDLMSEGTVSIDLLFEEWPCDIKGGCRNHYK